MLLSDEMVVDNFAGGGGASEGIEAAIGRHVDLAVNHDPVAVRMHELNHPKTETFCQDIWEVDPLEACGGRRVGLAWFSPDCCHFSRAKGGKPRSQKIRSLADVVIEWARKVHPRVIFLENVEEFEGWGPLLEDGTPDKERAGQDFKAWCKKLTDLGYVLEHRVLVAADYGTPTSRRRLFLVARCDGRPIVWPEPTHGTGRSEPWRPAAEVIDWTRECPSIFGRKKSLAPATERRIAFGFRRYVAEAAEPFVIPLGPSGLGGRAPLFGDAGLSGIDGHPGRVIQTPFIKSDYKSSIGRSAYGPLPTVTAGGGGHHSIVIPTLIQRGYGERPGQRPRVPGLEKPLGTAVAGGVKHALVTFVAKHYTGVVGHGMRRPFGAVTARDHHSLVVGWLEKLYSSARCGAPVTAPLPSVTAGGGHLAEVRAFLRAHGATAPGRGGRPAPEGLEQGVVHLYGTSYQLVDIGMRMLAPVELFRAQGFRRDYIIDFEFDGKPVTQTDLVRLAGNSVCPPLARAVVRANMEQ